MSRRAVTVTIVLIALIVTVAVLALTYSGWWAGVHQACVAGTGARQFCSSVLPQPVRG